MFISIKAAKFELRERCLNIDSKLHIGSPQVVVVVFVFNFSWRQQVDRCSGGQGGLALNSTSQPVAGDQITAQLKPRHV